MSALHQLATIPAPRGALATWRALPNSDKWEVLRLRDRRRRESLGYVHPDDDGVDLYRGRRGLGRGDDA